MDDVLDILQELNEPVSVPLELPDDDLLVEVEEELLMPLPDDLRDYLLHGSDVVYGSLEPVTVADPRSHTYLPEVAAQAWNDGLPRYLLPICQCDACYYCIDQEGQVLFWNGRRLGRDQQGNMAWPNLWQWMKVVWLQAACATLHLRQWPIELA